MAFGDSVSVSPLQGSPSIVESLNQRSLLLSDSAIDSQMMFGWPEQLFLSKATVRSAGSKATTAPAGPTAAANFFV